MRRTVLMVALAAVAVAVLPPSAPAAPAGPNFELGGAPCTLIPVPAAGEGATPVGAGTCPGVRPGAQVTTEIGLCTFNFMFLGSDGIRYMGTAGHCILGSSPVGGATGEQSWKRGEGPPAMDADGNRIGEFAYAVLESPKDFALIRVDDGVDASPEMCHFGGPTASFEEDTGDPVVLEYFGNGVGIGSILPARSAVSFGTPSPDHVFAFGLALPGDSGSGVISSDGRAVGVLVTTGVHGFALNENGVDIGTMGITRLGPQVAQAQTILGISLTLQTV